jgi:hypothetical protein
MKTKRSDFNGLPKEIVDDIMTLPERTKDVHYYHNKALNEAKKKEKPLNIKDEAKRAWRAVRIKNSFIVKLSTTKLSYYFKCSENIICKMIRANEKRDTLPSSRIRWKRHISIITPFNDDIPY